MRGVLLRGRGIKYDPLSLSRSSTLDLRCGRYKGSPRSANAAALSLAATFTVKNIARARKQLEDKGVKFDGETLEIPSLVKLATFFDPDGNSLMLFQTLAETSQ